MGRIIPPSDPRKTPGVLLGLMLVIGCIATGLVVFNRSDGTPPPGASQGATMVQVAVPSFTPLEARGREAYNQSCAACHGPDAAGQAGVAPPLVHIIYEPNHHGDEAFYRAALYGVRGHHWPFGDMPAVEGMTREALAPVIAYIRALQVANGIE